MHRQSSRSGVMTPANDRFASIASMVAVCTLVCALYAPGAAHAQTIWTGGTDDWFTAGNWSLGVPNSSSPVSFDAVVENGGTAQLQAPGGSVRRLRIGRAAGGGNLLIDAGVLTVTENLHLNEGSGGTASMTLQNGGIVTSPQTVIGYSSSMPTSLTIHGAGTTYNATTDLTLARSGAGPATLMLDTGAVINAGTSSIGTFAGSNGTATVQDAGSQWSTTGAFVVGNSGTGTLNILNQGTVSVGTALSINASSNIILNGGTLRFNTVTGLNRLTYTSGTIQLAGDRDLLVDALVTPVIHGLYGANPVIQGGKALKIEGQTIIRQDKTLVVNGGAFTSQGNLTVGVQNSAGGLFQVNNGGTAAVNANAAIDHFGNIYVNGAGSSMTVAGNLNMGQVSRGDLLIQNQGTVYINNSLTIGTGGNFLLDGGTLRFNGYSRTTPTFNFSYTSGTVQLAGNRTIGSDTAVTDFFGAVPNIPAGKGLIVEGTAILTATAPVTLSGGTLGAGTLLLSPGSQLTTTQPSLVFGPVLALAGSVINPSGNDLTLGDAGKVNGFYGNGTLLVGQSTVTLADANDAVFDSAALISLGNGASPGTLNADNGLTLDFGGNVTGFGTLSTPNNAAKPLINNGHIAGNSPAEPVTLTGYVKGVGTLDNAVITGTDAPGFSPATVYRGSVGYAGRLEIEIGGLSTGAFDRLVHSGTATLGGTLDLTLINGFSPGLGDTFEMLTANSITGTFNNILGADLGGGLMFDVVYAPTNVSLHVVSSLLDGDLNGDGFVGIADLNIVLGNWNQGVDAGVWGVGDPTGDGFVGIADLNEVLGNWNAGTPPAGAASAVPEPGTLACTVAPLSGLVVRRTRGGRG